MVWNVRGSMRMLHADDALTGMLQHYDIVGLAHTGTDSETDAMLPGFTCLRALLRPGVHTKDGGVAMLVRDALRPRVTVVQQRAELGMLWARVAPPPGSSARPTFVALCYLPHQASRVYSTGPFDMQAHWETLSADVASFAAAGQVVLMGDFNARVARDPEWGGEGGDEDGLPPHPALLTPRGSQDRLNTANPMGRQLLQLCRTHGLAILNGRMRGDEQGACTHVGPTGRSQLDYVIASPALAFGASGGALPGCGLRVWHEGDARQLPNPKTDGAFDHVPVGAHIRWAPPGSPARPQGAAPKRPAQAASERWVWRDELREPWLAALGTPEVAELLQAMTGLHSAIDLERFTQALTLAVRLVHAQCGRVIVKDTPQTPQHRPANGWYDAACAEARQALRAAEHSQGRGSEAAKLARKAYRKHVCKAKAAFEQAQQDKMMAWLYENPKKFWDWYKGKSGKGQVPGGVEACTDKFRTLFEGQGGAGYAGGSLEAHCSLHPDLFPAAPSAADLTQASSLNEPFGEAELLAAVASLQNHKAARGMPAEFVSKAWVLVAGAGGRPERHYLLVPPLVRLMNAVFSGAYPCAWETSTLSPVPKPKGDPLNLDDYRGVAVGEVLAKLYAMCLHGRLDEWAEGRQGTRAAGQAGFRKGRSTSDNAFVLRHMIESHASHTPTPTPMHVAFIDFSKAYDRIDRDLMWRVLEGMGVHGAALTALRRMYTRVRMEVRVGSETGGAFEAGVGVKQGCPLSPLLFGIFIDRLEPFLAARCGGEGAQLAGALLRCLLYADDVALLATSAAGLQRLLDALHAFCTANGMIVNSDKSKVVVFNSQGARRPGPATYKCGDLSLERVPRYQYLGLWFEDDSTPPGKRPLRGALSHALGKARTAMNTLLARATAIKLHNSHALGHLFDALVRSVACAGSEVWGVDHVSGVCRTGDFGKGKAEVLHYDFWRRVWGLPKATPSAPLLLEAGRQPFSAFWLRMAAQLWNKGLGRGAGDLLGQAMRENVGIMATGQPQGARSLWARHFTTCLDSLGVSWRGEGGALARVDAKALAGLAMDKWLGTQMGGADGQDWARCPLAVRAAPDSFSTGFMRVVYQAWFRPHGGRAPTASPMFHLDQTGDIQAVMRFRLGAHALAVREGRWGGRKPRSQRVCPRCPGSVEDEMHLWECPLYDGVRGSFPSLCEMPASGWTDRAFCERMNGASKQHWVELAQFLRICTTERATFVLALQQPP